MKKSILVEEGAEMMQYRIILEFDGTNPESVSEMNSMMKHGSMKSVIIRMKLRLENYMTYKASDETRQMIDDIHDDLMSLIEDEGVTL